MRLLFCLLLLPVHRISGFQFYTLRKQTHRESFGGFLLLLSCIPNQRPRVVFLYLCLLFDLLLLPVKSFRLKVSYIKKTNIQRFLWRIYIFLVETHPKSASQVCFILSFSLVYCCHTCRGFQVLSFTQ